MTEDEKEYLQTIADEVYKRIDIKHLESSNFSILTKFQEYAPSNRGEKMFLIIAITTLTEKLMGLKQKVENEILEEYHETKKE